MLTIRNHPDNKLQTKEILSKLSNIREALEEKLNTSPSDGAQKIYRVVLKQLTDIMNPVDSFVLLEGIDDLYNDCHDSMLFLGDWFVTDQIRAYKIINKLLTDEFPSLLLIDKNRTKYDKNRVN